MAGKNQVATQHNDRRFRCVVAIKHTHTSTHLMDHSRRFALSLGQDNVHKILSRGNRADLFEVIHHL